SSKRDWSSDVCSSDLGQALVEGHDDRSGLLRGKDLQSGHGADRLGPVDDRLFDLVACLRGRAQTVGEVAILLGLNAAHTVDGSPAAQCDQPRSAGPAFGVEPGAPRPHLRSEEHTSDLQSRFDLVCRLLLEKKKIYLYRKRSMSTCSM